MVLEINQRESILQKILVSLSSEIRETDVSGWYKNKAILGVIFTGVTPSEGTAITNAVLTRVTTALRTNLGPEELGAIDISVHVFPEEWDNQKPGPLVKLDLYPEISEQKSVKKTALFLKRAMDVVGSVIALVVLSPLLLVISLLIKLTSKGPILFRQVRVGQYGKKFTFLKFRTMPVGSDPAIHKDYVSRFISGKTDSSEKDETRVGVYKIQWDPRVTRVGRFLRRTSLDELPQFLNVLTGEVSLVGPRPPIPYELDVYDIWHRCRVLEVKPGITGLWQVSGRSRIKFDDMVRLDLRYARTWSLWLDIKILLQTLRAVFAGEGAY